MLMPLLPNALASVLPTAFDADQRYSVDLHMHSTASDGLFSPRELVDKADLNGVKLLALTDHDTLSGLSDMQSAVAAVNQRRAASSERSSDDAQAGDSENIKWVSGIELSDSKKSVGPPHAPLWALLRPLGAIEAIGKYLPWESV